MDDDYFHLKRLFTVLACSQTEVLENMRSEDQLYSLQAWELAVCAIFEFVVYKVI